MRAVRLMMGGVRPAVAPAPQPLQILRRAANRPAEPAPRAFPESRFGRDFSDVSMGNLGAKPARPATAMAHAARTLAFNDSPEREAEASASRIGHSSSPLSVRHSVPGPAQSGAGPMEITGDQSAGRPLPSGDRRFFESRFGHDFGKVKVFADSGAGESAKSMSARAYTIGHNIVFGNGQFSPGTSEGRKLLAHELTHVVQQSAGGASLGCPLVQKQGDGEEAGDWAPDKDGELYFKTKQQAEARMKALKAKGEFKRYRVRSFQAKGGTFWRVELSGAVKSEDKEAPPGKKQAPPDVGAKPGADEKAPKQEHDPEAGKGKDKEKVKDQPPPAKKAKAEADAGPPPKTSSGKACLTFDDGPQPGTADVLDVLKAKGAKATFFLTGSNMAPNAAVQTKLVERVLSESHQIGNHTYTHSPEVVEDYETVYGDLSDPAKLKKFTDNYKNNEAYFAKLLGKKFPGFSLARLPGGGRFVKVKGSLILVNATEGMGMAHVAWQIEFAPNHVFRTLKILDWQGVSGVAAELKRLPLAGEIILLHDRHWNGKQALLGKTLDKVKTSGLSFGQLDLKTGKCG